MWFFLYRAKRLAENNVPEMTHLVSSGTLILAPSIPAATCSVFAAVGLAGRQY